MSNPNNSPAENSVLSPDETPFSITRVFDAPRDLVWKVLTEPSHLMHWWGPKGMDMIAAKVDLRPGGLFHYGLKMPNGHEMWGKWVFDEIVPPDYLTFIQSFSDAQGGLTRHPMNENWPLETMNRISLSEQDGRTTLTITGAPINASEAERKTFRDGHAGMQQGFGGTMNQLEEYLKTL